MTRIRSGEPEKKFGKNTIREWGKEIYDEKMKKSKGKLNINREKCIEYFSNGKNICNCCGEDNVLFLTLSHVDGDGWLHRKVCSGNIVNNLVKNNFKTNYNIEIECYNCNLARERNGGICPHNG